MATNKRLLAGLLALLVIAAVGYIAYTRAPSLASLYQPTALYGEYTGKISLKIVESVKLDSKEVITQGTVNKTGKEVLLEWSKYDWDRSRPVVLDVGIKGFVRGLTLTFEKKAEKLPVYIEEIKLIKTEDESVLPYLQPLFKVRIDEDGNAEVKFRGVVDGQLVVLDTSAQAFQELTDIFIEADIGLKKKPELTNVTEEVLYTVTAEALKAKEGYDVDTVTIKGKYTP